MHLHTVTYKNLQARSDSSRAEMATLATTGSADFCRHPEVNTKITRKIETARTEHILVCGSWHMS